MKKTMATAYTPGISQVSRKTKKERKQIWSIFSSYFGPPWEALVLRECLGSFPWPSFWEGLVCGNAACNGFTQGRNASGRRDP